jgi:hypothetical protein
LISLFKRVEYRIVEVEKPRTIPHVEGNDLREGLSALQTNPFFKYLLDRLRVQRNMVKGRLEGTRHKTLDEVSFLQQGVYWTGWLEAELGRLTQAPAKPTMTPEEEELKAFEEVDRLIERVGSNSSL